MAAEYEAAGEYQDATEDNTTLVIGPTLDGAGVMVRALVDGLAESWVELTPEAALQLGMDITLLANDVAGAS